MPGVFINHRRDDSAGDATFLFDRLTRTFAPECVFLDTQTIRPADEFASVILHRVRCSDVLLVLIGPRWLDASLGAGGRRLDDPNDFVRVEIATALRSNLAVIPVLVRQAHMPVAMELPEDIQQLAGIQAMSLSINHLDADVRSLSRIIRQRFRVPRSRVRRFLLAYRPRPSAIVVGWCLRTSFYVIGLWTIGWVIGIPAAARDYGTQGAVLQVVVALSGLVIALVLAAAARYLDLRCK